TSCPQIVRQAVVGGAYTYMNINSKYTKDLELLIPAYNHYVHFLQKNQYKREKKEIGKFRADEECKVIGRARDPFPLAQRLPKRYQRIISDVNAHSNDEYNPAKGVYHINTLKFRSENATKFFRRLDAAILQSDDGQRDFCWISMTPTGSTTFCRSRGLMWPIPAKALLPDASQSLLGKQVPSEKLTDKQFNLKFLDQLSAPYDLTHEIESYDDNKETDDEYDGSYVGEEIDLENTSGSGDEDTFDDVDQEDVDFVEEVMDGDDDDYDGYNDREEEAKEKRYNDMVLDEDPIW
ncbi:hypothetical protein VP01_2882g1, partial [Puccinia sorghi]